MARIRCHYLDCAFVDAGYCGAAAVEIDPGSGCLTYSPASVMSDEDEWIDEELDEWEEIEPEDEEEDTGW